VNVFNRIVTILLAVVLFIAIVIMAVFPVATLDWVGRLVESWGDYLAYWNANARYLSVGIRSAVVVVAAGVFALLMFLELRRRRANAVQVVTAEGGKATVVTDSVAQRLMHHIDLLADVVSVAPKVTGRGRTVHLELDLETGPEIDVPMKSDEVVAVCREVVEDRMGLQLGRVNVRIRHAPYPVIGEE
jgi:hypothetical protein